MTEMIHTPTVSSFDCQSRIAFTCSSYRSTSLVTCNVLVFLKTTIQETVLFCTFYVSVLFCTLPQKFRFKNLVVKETLLSMIEKNRQKSPIQKSDCSSSERDAFEYD